MFSAETKKIITQVQKRRFSGRSVRSVSAERPSAFSKQSRLARFVVRLSGKPKRALVLRSNLWPKTTVVVARALARGGNVHGLLPITYNQRTRRVLYEEVPGRPLRALPLTRTAFEPVMANVGKALAGFHNTTIPAILKQPNQNAEWISLNRIHSTIAAAEPRYGVLGSSLVRSVVNWERAHWSRKQFRLTHGDFQASNILLGPDKRINVIDYTLSRRFFPGTDLGTFIVHFQAMTRSRLAEAVRCSLLKRFVYAYLRAQPASVRGSIATSIPIFTAAAALDVVATTLRSYGPDDANARALVDLLFQPRFLALRYD